MITMNEDRETIFLMSPSRDGVLHKWKRTVQGETLEDLAFEIHDYFRGRMTLHEISQFIDNVTITPNSHRFGTAKQWNAISIINERHNKQYAPTSYEEMKEILNKWLK